MRSVAETWTGGLCGSEEHLDGVGPPPKWTRLLVRVSPHPLAGSDDLFHDDLCPECRDRIVEAFSVRPGLTPAFQAMLRKKVT